MFNYRREYQISPVIPYVQIVGEAFNQGVLGIANKEFRIFIEQSPSVSQMPAYQKFANLVATWKKETAVVSSGTELFSNQSYLNIIGMGQMATPLLLLALKQNPDHYFVALKSITGI